MKHLGIIKKIAGAVAAALVLGSAVLGCSMFDSSDSSDSSDTNGGKARLLFSESGMRSLITPTAVQESDITKAELKAAPLEGEAETLKVWNSVSEKTAVTLMTEEQNLFVDAGTYDFTLNLYVKLGNEEILCQSGVLKGKNVVSGDNRLDFETQYVSDGKGKLSVSLTLDANSGVDKIAYEIFALKNDLSLAETAAATGLVDGGSFSASLVSGYYSILLKLYNGTSLLNTLDYTAKIMAGCTSQGMLNITDVNTLHSLTFMLGNDVEWVNNPGEILRNSSTKIKLPAASDIKREGYRLLGWHTEDEDFQTVDEYKLEEEIRIETDTVLYADWKKVFIVTFVDGTESSTVVVDSGNKVEEPVDPEKDGCIFLGWYNEDTKYNFDTPVTKGITLTAKWQRGNGSAETPYLIGTIEEWNAFADAVTDGNAYEGKFIKMDADVGTEAEPVTVMAGHDDGNKHFKGTFDGNNHSLTVCFDENSKGFAGYRNGNGCAPFKYVDGATIKNLTVKGTLKDVNYYSAGLVGESKGTVSITNCVSEVEIIPSASLSNKNADASGFVGSNYGNLIISDSLFKGSFLKNKNQYGTVNNYGAAGFVARDSGTTSLTNCIFSPVRITMGDYCSAPFCSGKTPSMNSCYYTVPFGASQGSLVYENVEDITNGFYEPVTLREKDYYAIKNVAIDGMSDSYIHTGSEISITYTVKEGENPLTEGTDYTKQILKNGESGEESSLTSVSEAGTYVLVITGAGSYSGILKKTFYVFEEIKGAGTESDPYTIESELDWSNFATRVTNGTTYEGKYIKMTADIGSEASPVTVMASGVFNGTFDGNGHVLTIAYVTETKDTAPFYHIDTGATVKNLRVSGSIETSKNNAGGLAVICSGTIQNCLVTVSITSSANNVGGLLSGGSNSTITNCVFAGKFIVPEGSAPVEAWGGIAGNWANDATWSKCVFAPSEISGNFNTGRCGTFEYGGYPNCTECYYTKKFGTYEYYGWTDSIQNPDASLVYENTTDYNGLCKEISAIAGKTFYLPYETTVEGLEEIYSVGSTPTYTVKIKIGEGDSAEIKTLSPTDDYGAKITNENGNTVTSISARGEYTLTIIGKNEYKGKKIVHLYSGALTGSGTEDDPYLITSAADWRLFGNSLKIARTDEGAYYGKFLKLTNDIGSAEDPVTEMLGAGAEYNDGFKGTLEGNGKTLTVSLKKELLGVPEYIKLAPIYRISGATIKNLTVEGSITASSDYYSTCCAGLVCEATGSSSATTSTIENCTCNVDISCNTGTSSASENGGFVHKNSSILNVKNCIFNGKMSGSSNGNGGFVGFSSGTCNIESCLFIPSELTMDSTDSFTFVRGSDTVNIIDSAYSKPFGEPQGNVLLSNRSDIPENSGIYRYSDSIGYYVPCKVSGIDSNYQLTGNVINPVPSVISFDGSVLTAGTDYEVSYSGDGKTAGTYTVTITGNGSYFGSVTKTYSVSLFINMRTSGSETYEMTASTPILKVYDDGGKTGDYSNSCNGSLLIKAPAGYKLKLEGTVTSESNYDYLEAFDGTENASESSIAKKGNISGDEVSVTTTGNNLFLHFSSDGSNVAAGLDLTVTLVE